MNPAVLVRVVTFFLCLPLGGVGSRLAAGLVFGGFLANRLSGVAGGDSLPALLAEALLGAALGVLAGIPVHAARSLRGDGPPALAFAGRVWAWALFFAVGGPGLVLAALSATFAAVPGGAWPDASTLTERGGLLFYAALVLGLPLFLGGLVVEPAAALLDRLAGTTGLSATGTAARTVVGPLALLVAAPWLADELRGLWLAALGAP